MSLPSGRQDVVGNLVLAATSELSLTGTINNGASKTSNDITVPVPATCVLLVQLSSGTARVSIDAHSGTPTFPSVNGDDSQQVISGEQVYVYVDTDATNNKVTARITNNSGTTLTISEAALLVLAKLEDKENFYGRGNALMSVASTAMGDGSGVFSSNLDA